MREIKFRMWQPIIKEMFSHGMIFYAGAIDAHNKQEIILMQYTGLKDKNGKEIYEGDILKNPRYEESYVVEYHGDGYVGWGDDRRSGCYLITDEDIEIIGNIHENPELIK
jgi:uncharacterized phage protein (TIGR01671 family)